jgi:putative iron-regulated protein
MTKYLCFVSFATMILFAGCKKEEITSYSPVINNVTDNIIVATYTDLDAKAQLLVDAANALKADPSSIVKLSAARNAWVATRAPWESSEGFLFGPVSTLEIDPNMDTWPLDSIGVDDILSGTDVINKAYIDALTGDAGTGLKGFHAIEYILWGSDGNRAAGTFSARELDYLVACAESLKGKTAELKEAWGASGGNYANELKSRGSIYPTEKAVLVELAEGIRGIAGEVFSSKIQNTLDGLDLSGVSGGIREEESRFSNNNKTDFTNNIISIQNVYLGTYGNTGNGKGLSVIVAAENAALDTKIKTQISEAIAAIQAIGGNADVTFSTALSSERASIEAAQLKVKTLETTLRTELLTLISNL